jgi:hypothetical protein
MSSSHCIENPPNLNSGIHGVGTVLELGGLQSYVTGPSHSKLALILISDVFGKIQNPSSISHLSIFSTLILMFNLHYSTIIYVCSQIHTSVVLILGFFISHKNKI